MDDIFNLKLAEAGELVSTGALDSAESIYKGLIVDYPHSGEPYCPLAEIELKRGHFSSAEQLFLKAIEYDCNKAWAHMGLGGIYRERGNWSAASDHYRAALAIKSGIPWANVFMGDIEAREGNWEGAFEWYQRAISLDETLAWASAGLGDCYAHWGQWEEALTCYEKASELSPDDAPIREALQRARGQIHSEEATLLLSDADAAFAQGELQKAERLYQELIRVTPEGAHSRCRLGAIKIKIGEFEKAKEYYQQAINAEPQNIWAIAGLANSFGKLKQWKEAIAYYEQALRYSPESDFLSAALHESMIAYAEQQEEIENLLRNGDRAFSQGQVADAEGCYLRLIEVSPTMIHPLCRLGKIALGRGELEAAEQYYRNAVSIDPDDVWAQYGLGNACIARRKWRDAKVSLGRAAELKPDAEYMRDRYYDAISGEFVEHAERFMGGGNIKEARIAIGLSLLHAPGAQPAREVMARFPQLRDIQDLVGDADGENNQIDELALQRVFLMGLSRVADSIETLDSSTGR